MRMNNSVKVFVDDYVTENLPDVCVITGEPTGRRLAKKTHIRSAGWWFLLFIPVVGWVVLLAGYFSGSTTELSGSLPYSAEAWETYKRRRRTARFVMLAGMAGFVLGVWILTGPVLPGVLGLVGLVAMMLGCALMIWNEIIQPTISLDASRRCVTIQGVHSRFVDAVNSQIVRHPA